MPEYEAVFVKSKWGRMRFNADNMAEAEKTANRDGNDANIIEDTEENYLFFDGWEFQGVEEVEE